MKELVLVLTAAILSLAAAGAIIRIAVGPSLLDRVLASDVLLAILGAVFTFLPQGHVKYFFVLFLPLIWIAARQGLTGAAAGLAFIQVGLIIVAQASGTEASTLLELQARMLGLSVTGLLLGVVVDERERAQERLRQSLRLAAAGEMAAALAHEVNQPLTALVTYGRACEHMLSQAQVDTGQLAQTVGKLTEQAQRLGSIVKRLRDFLRHLVAWSARERRSFRTDELPALMRDATRVEARDLWERGLR